MSMWREYPAGEAAEHARKVESAAAISRYASAVGFAAAKARWAWIGDEYLDG